MTFKINDVLMKATLQKFPSYFKWNRSSDFDLNHQSQILFFRAANDIFVYTFCNI